MCWDIIAMDYHAMLSKIEKRLSINKVESFVKKLDCGFDVSIMLNRNYQAVVLTDVQQEILWVNKGFTEMTGYSRKYAIGRRPSFLQGVNTSPETKRQISRLTYHRITL